MNHLRMALESVSPLAHMTKVMKEPEGLWFRHTSPWALAELKPLSYDELKKARPDYDVAARKRTELKYHRVVRSNPDMSFLYATLVGYHHMEDVLSYPGYTYFFKLELWQIPDYIFDIVDQKHWMEPTKGIAGYTLAREIWTANHNKFKSYEEKGIGMIDPRVEVIIPHAIKPELYVPQEEDR